MSPGDFDVDLDDDIESQMRGASPTTTTRSKNNQGKPQDENAAFLKKLDDRAHGRHGFCSKVFKFMLFLFLLPFKMPTVYLYRFVKFTCKAFNECSYWLYAKFMWDCLGRPVRKINKMQYLLSKYMNQQGSTELTFTLLKLSDEERLEWVEFWSLFDVDGDDCCDIGEFAKLFQVEDIKQGRDKDQQAAAWIDRFFAVFDEQSNGYVKFGTFLQTCWSFGTFDRERTIELSFRLLSRRGSGNTFDMATTILDAVDIENFVRLRYLPFKKKRHADKYVKETAAALMEFLDSDLSGGMDYKEFRDFTLGTEDDTGCYKGGNRVFLLYGFWFQSQLRKCVMGADYWLHHTEMRRRMFKYDRVFENEMMGMLDNDATVGIGMHAMTSAPLSKGVKIDFRTDFNEAW